MERLLCAQTLALGLNPTLPLLQPPPQLLLQLQHQPQPQLAHLVPQQQPLHQPPQLPQQPLQQPQPQPQQLSTPTQLGQVVRHLLVQLLEAIVSSHSLSRVSATMDVLSGCMEESLVARLGAVPWWMPLENMWMELETGESVLTPVNNIAILDSYNCVLYWEISIQWQQTSIVLGKIGKNQSR